ncbi:MAG: hypothetical protein H5T69_11775 [Chloroflexi bacterium]|nr:hypothetical protein [Chloroflexota bacterium]
MCPTGGLVPIGLAQWGSDGTNRAVYRDCAAIRPMVIEMQRNRILLGRFAIVSLWLIPIGLLFLLFGMTMMAFQRSKAMGYGLLFCSIFIFLLVVILFRVAFIF